MKFKRREKPLESFESIAERNGIHFDKTKPFRPIKIVCEDGSTFVLDKDFNMFTKLEDLYPGIVLKQHK